MSRKRAALLMGTIFSGGFAAPAIAQTQPYAPPAAPAINSTVDANGVDLVTGKLNITTASVAIGPSDGTGLSYVASLDGTTVRNNVEGAIYSFNGIKHIVSVAGSSFEFTKTAPTTFVEVTANGHTLSYDGTNFYTFTMSDGSVYRFSYLLNTAPNGPGPDGYDLGAVVDVTAPSGEKRTYSYRREVKPILNGRTQIGTAAFRRVQSVVSNAGWMIKPEYLANSLDTNLANWQLWLYESNIKAFDNNVVGCSPSADNCTIPAGQQWPQLTAHAYANWVPNGGSGYTISGYRRPTTPVGTDNLTATYSSGRVASIVNNGVGTSYTYVDVGPVRTTTRTTGTATEEYKFEIATGLMKQSKNALGAVTLYEHNSAKLLSRIVFPEGNSVEYSYDARGNATQAKAVAKPGSLDAPIITSALFPASCSGNVACNKPIWTRDAKGNQTDYTYDPVHGGVLTVTSPADAAGVRPQTRFGYTALAANTGSIVKLTSTSTCRAGASCTGTADEIRSVISYGTVTANNLQPQSITAGSGDGSLNATGTITYTPAGDPATVDGPLSGAADTIRKIYDPSTRRVIGEIGPDPDGAGARKSRATRLTYNLDGQITNTEIGVTDGQSDTNWSNLTPLEAASMVYDVHGRSVKTSITAGGTTYGVIQRSYDALGRLDCSVQRMDPAQWSAQTNACLPQTTGANGPDRVSRNYYDAAGHVVKTQKAYGTAAQADEVSAGYTGNGRIAHVVDAEGNRTSYSYDGHDRPLKTEFPSTTKGANSSNTSDYEQLTYDAAGNVTSRRLRDGTTIGYGYDNLNRLVSKDIPGSTNHDVTYGYDLLGRAASVDRGGSGLPLTFVHDALGRMTSQTQYLGTTSYTYDAAGRRTSMAYPGGVLTVNYDHDVTGQVTKIRENGATSGVGVLATYAYDNLGRRTSVTFGNGSSQSFTYGTDQRLATLTNNLGGAATTHDITQTFTYNPAGQIASVARSNDAYAWAAHYNVDRAYVADGLNRIMSAGGIGFGYDARGNLTSDGTNSFTYNSENLMTNGPNGATFKYDALGRLQASFATGAPFSTRYEYDGNDLIVEFDAPSTVLRRYVHGPGVDDPIAWYEGSAVNNTTRRFLMADERGSVMSITDSAGATIKINAYDQHGIPAPGNIGRFGYTGQTWMPEIGMWYYKARLYSPTLGRFMQSDPIGYGDGMNWYNYVGSDPVNSKDPSGRNTCIIDGQPSICVDGTRPVPGGGGALPPLPIPNVEFNLWTPSRMGPPGPQTVNPNLTPAANSDCYFVAGVMVCKKKEHKYNVDVDVGCSADQTFDAYLAARTAPGAERPSPGQTERNVELFGGNWIRQTIDYSNRTILNETIRGRHDFHPGSVFIRITPTDSGSNISIIGQGTGENGLLNFAVFQAFFTGGALAEKVRCAVMGDDG